MGYTTTFTGRIEISPPLDSAEIDFLLEFADHRRMHRRSGPYGMTDGYNNPDVIDYNEEHPGQPSLWCQWIPTEDGTAIEWDEGEKFCGAEEWMRYLIDHFLKPGCHAIGQVPGIKGGHVCNGTIDAEGEEQGDVWKLVVENNVVTRRDASIVFDDEERDEELEAAKKDLEDAHAAIESLNKALAGERAENAKLREALTLIAAVPSFPSKDIADKALGVTGPEWEPRAKKEFEARKGASR